MLSSSFLSRFNLDYIENLYKLYLQDPSQIDLQWQIFFEGMAFSQDLDRPSSLSKKDIFVHNLIGDYRVYGHLDAHLNPLSDGPPVHPSLTLSKYFLEESDLDSTFDVGAAFYKPRATLREIISHLHKAYCGTLAVQVSETIPEIREWFIHEFESHTPTFHLSKDEKRMILEQITRSESLEHFLHMRFTGLKRFSLEGAEALIPMLEWLVSRGTTIGMEEVVLGMAHRGRINVMANFLNKGLDVIFTEFEGKVSPTAHEHDGDVKYHMGFSADKSPGGRPCHISLAFNPSHLEAVDPVALGMTRAKQRVRKDTGPRKKVVPVVIHGDAAVAGQGVVSECMQLSNLEGYKVGGTIHIIIDNQVGFTATPDEGRSTLYSSDVFLSSLTPILHVNGDDADQCVRAMDMAIRFRQRFGQDVVIVLMCYRRHGHNEGDEPSFTQPLMYEVIRNHPTLRQITAERYIKEGVVTVEEAEQMKKEDFDEFQKILDRARAQPPEIKPIAFSGLWSGLRKGIHEDFDTTVPTGVSRDVISQVGPLISHIPSTFSLNSKLKKLLEKRNAMVAGKEPLDWGCGELLAYATLLHEGTSVRLSGQDSMRGTFTHRHCVFFDTETGERFSPLTQVNPSKEFCVYNSPLSEYAVLGFEYGNAISDPTFLTIWEAQFGDFANTAQVIIDQFLAAGETKWYRMCGLTLLLPHGYEGQGPEHSSARIERYLQLCAQDNLQICVPTSPAQMFHLLRRQVKRDFRKPLIVMTPKSLLRHPKCVSTLDEFTSGHFQELYGDETSKNPEKVSRIVMCSGKLYYEILADMEAKKVSHISLFRLEQIYPFPEKQLLSILKRFTKLKSLVWAQEEPGNMGALTFVSPLIQQVLKQHGKTDITLTHVARKEKASPATGSHKIHKEEQEQLIQRCLT